MTTNSPLNSSAIQPPLAVVGLSALFPKAANLDEFWSNIRRGVDAITEVPETHWNPDDYFDEDQKTPDMTYARRGGFLSPVPFDPLEFGISPNNLEAIDTSQLLGLVGAKRALEHAGYGASRQFDRSRIGCILGVTGTLEMVIPLGARLGHPRWRKALKDAGVPDDVAEDVVNRISHSYVPWQENSFPGLLGNVVAGRIANRLDLHGTNCVVDAACASSLSAIHLAALELWTGRSDMVVTGGIDTFNDIFMFMCFSKTPALSPTGDSKPFSDEADGTILGEGVGMLVLKRLADAERDGDRIYAVLKGIGTSSDGAGNAVYAPKAEGQIRCLEDAYRIANVSPDTIELVEAHGTGTKVGDATEVTGLMQVYKSTERQGAWCAIGSIKSQIGHTKAAAGAAGVIKAILALQHRVLPPTIKVNQPPAAMLADDSPFYVNTEARPWFRSSRHPRRAAVSAFGFGGSNFHCVLEESPQSIEADDWDGEVQVIALSSSSLPDLINSVRSTVAPLSKSDWTNVRTQAAATRKLFQASHLFRLLFVIEREKTDLEKVVNGALTMLDRYPEKTSWATPDGAYFGQGQQAGKLGILFPGQGSQYVGMLRELVCRFPSMREVIEEANSVFASAAQKSTEKRLSDYIYPAPAFSKSVRDRQEADLRATQIAQPAIGAVSLALLSILEHFRVRPDAVAGHSYGELTALCASKRFSPKALYQLSTLRGQLMAQSQESEGGMLAVLAPLNQIEAALRESSLDLVVANHNSPNQVVLSGRIPDIDQAVSLFASRNIRGKRLPVAAAFHSPLVAPATTEFRPALDEIEFGVATMPVYANSTATEYPSEPHAARDLLANQLARPVQFVHEIEQMYADGVRTFLEVGPGSVLSGLVNSILEGREFRAFATDSSNGRRNGLFDLASALANLAASAYPVQWERWDFEWTGSNQQKQPPRMQIPICGANHVKQREPIPPRPLLSLATSASSSIGSKGPSSSDRVEAENKGATMMVESHTPIAPQPSNTAPIEPKPVQSGADGYGKSITVSGTATGSTLDILRETLNTLQRMQLETNRIHQQFLDGQSAAIQTLQRLANQQLTELPSQSVPVAPEPRTIIPQPTSRAFTNEPAPAVWSSPSAPPVIPQAPVPAPAKAQVWSSSSPTAESREVNVQQVPDQSTSQPSNAAAAPPVAIPSPAPKPVVTSRLASTVLAVVSEKTGYPIEMLNLEMSLDHDLGIDSIKRVEILSALQERVESLPAFLPDELGTLHTLRDVVELADARAEQPAATSVAPVVASATFEVRRNSPVIESPTLKVSATATIPSRLAETVLSVVSEKTGYPVEMLNLGMSLDHDLGIDSIKRVEILSALQERVADLPAFQPEELGSLHTLQDVVSLADLRAGSVAATSVPLAAPPVPQQHTPVPATPKPNASHLSGTVLEVVSEKTGYPVDMLNLEMSLDHDLGIDSIKRVEILSALQERVPNLPAFQPEELGALHTLRDVVNLADARIVNSGSSPEPIAAPVQQIAIAATPPSAQKPVPPALISQQASSSGSLAQTVLKVVSEKTGYPVEMLNLEMSLDHDLGIDSIKRVEILSALQEQVPELPAFQPEELGALHTLNDVVTLADSRTQSAATVPVSQPTERPATISNETVVRQLDTRTPAVAASSLTRQIVRAVAIAPAATRPAIKLFPGSEIWITEDGLGVSLLVADHLAERGFRPRIVNLDEASSAVVPDGLAGLILIAPQRGMTEKQLWNALEWAQKVGPTLRHRGKTSPALLATVSRLDGKFGFEGNKRLHDPISGGLAGLTKCAEREWPEVTSRAFDLSKDWSAPHVAVAMLVTELLHEGPTEVGLTPTGPHALDVVEERLSGQFEMPPLRAGEVVVVTGGARGVTAAAAQAIARAWQPQLVILGRSPEPNPEPDWLIHLATEAEIKKALLARAPAGATPRTISNQCQEIQSAREVRQQLQRLRSSGVSVIYRSVDVRDPAAIRPLLSDIRRDLGPIRGIIHGAGVLADQRIEDKTLDQFERVYQTKVNGLKTLLDCVDTNELRILGVFSSYTARFGRVGQVDYAMANEVLNKESRQFAILHPNCRVASFNWGPWDGGMVNPGLKRLFESEGVGLIPIDEGADALVRELRQTTVRPIEVLILGKHSVGKASPGSPDGQRPPIGGRVVVTAPPSPAISSPAVSTTGQAPVSQPVRKQEIIQAATVALKPSVPSPQNLVHPHTDFTETLHQAPLEESVGFKLAFERDLDVAHHGVLESHLLGGKAVLPVALILEWMAHSAIHGNPGLELRGFDDFRVFQGVRLGQHDRVHLRFLTGKPVRVDSYFKIPMQMVGHVNGRDVINAGCHVVLAPGFPSAPAPTLHLPSLRPYSMDLSEAYDSRLFHGPKLRGLVSLEGCSDEGLVAMCHVAPMSSLWMDEPVRANWLADPMVIDSALQAVILWSQEMRGKPCLPCGITKYRQFRRAFPRNGAKIAIHVEPSHEQLIRCEIEFVDLQGLLIARMEGCESVADASLTAAFRRNRFES